MEDKEKDIQEMNKFLKGIHMGSTVFKDYIDKANAPALKKDLESILDSFKRHEEAITHRISQLGGNAADTIGVMGIMGEFVEKLKLLPVDTDKEVRERALRAIEMGIEQGNKFIDEHKDLDRSLMKEVKSVVNDYDIHLKKIKEWM